MTYESDLSGALLRTEPRKKRFWEMSFPEIAPGARVRHKLTEQSYVVVSRWFGVATLQYLVETPGLTAGGSPKTVKSTATVRVSVALLEPGGEK